MKKNIVYYLFLFAIILPGCFSTRNIKSDPPLNAEAVKALIDTRNFTFTPRYVNPLGGSRRNLTGEFEISISKDTIVSYLPYFGRAYVAPISPSDMDFSFTTTNFTYAPKLVNNIWNIFIKPKEKMNFQELYFRIYDNAAASLTITSVNRTSISYDGYISERKITNTKK